MEFFIGTVPVIFLFLKNFDPEKSNRRYIKDYRPRVGLPKIDRSEKFMGVFKNE